MKLLRLKNVYTGEIVVCQDINDVTEGNGTVFIRVFKEEYPHRTFLVNKEAFKLLSER